MSDLPITLPIEDIQQFCRQNGILRLSLFGSVLRDDFGPASDVDMLVEFQPDAVPGLIRLSSMELELGDLIGRRVDMNTPGGLSKHFVQQVRREALSIHDAT